MGNHLYSGSFYLNSGFAAGAGLQLTEEEVFPRFAFGYYGNQKTIDNRVKASIGLSYGFYYVYQFISLDLGIYKEFGRQTLYPSILQGIISPQLSVRTGKYHGIQMVPVFGLLYTQAFYITKTAYPFIGVGGDVEISQNTFSILLQAGINIDMGSK